MAEFVNPYTFVPFVPDPERRRPAGHAELGDGRYSGVVKIGLMARTPLLIGGFSAAEEADQKAPDVPRRVDGTPIVPGSGLLGALRSVHEALTGSCLRVLNTDRVPVHRHPASTAQTDELRLAVVADVTADGRATSVLLCDEPVIWVDRTLLPAEPLPRSGDRFGIPAGRAIQSGNRRVLLPRSEKHPDRVRPGAVTHAGAMSTALDDSWVLLVTGTNARPPDRPVFFAAGRLGLGARRAHVPEDGAWALYQKTVAGTDDLRPASQPTDGEPDAGVSPEYADVHWPANGGRLIGKRLKARTYLHKGQPVWVRVSKGVGKDVVTEIRLSQLWRYEGSGPVGERVGNARPCTDPEHLCWSCRIFGSADVSGRDHDEMAAQRSYRGHIRADDLTAAAGFEPLEWRLAPLSTPRPGAGQFYLDHTGLPRSRRLAAKDTEPAATWGSLADKDRLRPIRGRKFYWRTRDPVSGEFPRGQKREHQSETLSRQVNLIPAGTVFEGRVCFDNLSLADYGSLLVALDPRKIVLGGKEGWADTVTSIGGGKPFGFGAVNIDVRPAWVRTAGGRYLGSGDREPSVAEAVQAFCDEVPAQVTATAWAGLRHALTFGSVGDDLVWYPPGTKAGRDVERGQPEYDQSFGFFARTAGIALSKKARDLVVLPDAGAARQVLESAPAERELPKQDDRGRRGGR